MIVQEPVQAAIWHCLNHYNYSDAIFLSERLYAEVKTDESLYLLATAYYRNGQIDHAYHLLKGKASKLAHCRYLLGHCAYKLQKYAEAEAALTEHAYAQPSRPNSQQFEDIIGDYEDQAAFVLLLIAKIAAKTGRRQQAVEAYKRALKMNPFLWSSFERMCSMGEKPSPTTFFQLGDLENLAYCHGPNLNTNVESVVVSHNSNWMGGGTYLQVTPEGQESPPTYITPLVLSNNPVVNNVNHSVNSKNVCTPDESPLAQPLCLSGISLLPKSRTKLERLRIGYINMGQSPSFGSLIDRSEEFLLTPNMNTQQSTLTEANEQKSFTKKVRAHVGNLINRKDILQNSKTPAVFSQTGNLNNSIQSSTPSPNASVAQSVRRSSRLFSNNYSVKENNKSPNRNKFATPKSPSRKAKQRLPKCSLNDLNNYIDQNTKNRLTQKEKNETITSNDINKQRNSAIDVLNSVNNCYNQTNNTGITVTQLQKQSAEGLMCLLRELGQATLHLSQFNCKATINALNNLPPNQFHTSWVHTLLGLAYFEMADYENCVKYFGEIHSKEPYQTTYMDIYSTALWHLQKEVALSALVQDLIQTNKNSPITWIVTGNCFSLHKEHDTAIKFLHRAVQVDPELPYAYTLLGHEYMMTEELDKAMSCYRNAIRLDPRHYNAWFGIGTIYSKQERFHLAEINYNRALSINTQSSVIMCHIGVAQLALKKRDKALATFNAAIANDPKNPLCKFHRGSLYFAFGRHSEALKELEELKQIVPKESLVYYLIGKVHKKLGNTDLALMHFSWATDLDPKGASSQIKEAFDPSIGRSADLEAPSTPSVGEYPSEGGNSAGQHHEGSGFGGFQEDSDDSL